MTPFTADGERNRKVIQDALAAGPVMLPPMRIPLTGGLVVGEKGILAGSSGTVLAGTEVTPAPVIHVVGGHASVRDLTIELPASAPGPHDGARYTAVTVGDYLYQTQPDWIDSVTVERLRVIRPSQSPANSIAVMGAVRGATIRDIEITGGGTGVAVHWGAVAASVSEITGPSYHPCHLAIERLRVRDAFEGFYLSSVHDVSVTSVTCDNVEIGFRLLPGDNADVYHESPDESQVSQRIKVRDVRVSWRGIYAIRIAGWGRSEVDRSLRRLPYRDVVIEHCDLTALPAAIPRAEAPTQFQAAVVIERADGLRFADLTSDIGTATIDGRLVELADLVQLPDRQGASYAAAGRRIRSADGFE